MISSPTAPCSCSRPLGALALSVAALCLVSCRAQPLAGEPTCGHVDETCLLQTSSSVAAAASPTPAQPREDDEGLDLLNEVSIAAVLVPLVLIFSKATRSRQLAPRGSASKAGPRPAVRALRSPQTVDEPPRPAAERRAATAAADRGAGSQDRGARLRQIASAAKRGDLRWAESLAGELAQGGVPLSTVAYGTLIGACAKAGETDRAEHWMHELIGAGVGKPNVISFNIVISACAKANAVDRAEAWMRRMAGLQVEPDTLSYNALIDACARAGDADRAQLWLSRMRGSKTPPNLISFNSVVHACANGSDLGKAEQVFAQMLRDGIRPDAVSYSTLIHACARSGDLARAVEWLEHMTAAGVEPDDVIYNAVINVCARAGDPDSAEAWLAKMEASGLRANLPAFNSVINACARAGDLGRAQRWMAEMARRGIRPDNVSFSTLAHAASRADDFQQMAVAADRCARQGPGRAAAAEPRPGSSAAEPPKEQPARQVGASTAWRSAAVAARRAAEQSRRPPSA